MNTPSDLYDNISPQEFAEMTGFPFTKNLFAQTISVPSEDISDKIFNGVSGFEWQDGFKSVVWYPNTGWEVCTGRGTIGRGETYNEALNNESLLYDKAWLEFTSK